LNSQSRHFRIHTDGAARGNPGPAGAAAILYDSEGAVVAEVTRYLGVATNNFAEYTGLLLGLNRARELGAESVEIVTDSELMAKQWNGEYRVKNEVLKPLYKEAKECARSIGRVEVRHVRRGGNTEADAAANRAIDEETGA
jgi:ribonuclease HI